MRAPAEHETPAAIAFGGFVIDRDAHRLLEGRRSIELRRKAWQVLLYLAERPGRLVPRDELLAACWTDTTVTPQTLTNVIREIRTALRDDPRRPRWIETVHAEGYRFSGETRAQRGGDGASVVASRESHTAARLETVRRAALEAQRRSAFREAVVHLDSAIALLDAAGDATTLKGELLALRGSTQVLAGGYARPDVLASFVESKRLLASSPRGIALAVIGIAVYHLITAKYDDALAWTEELMRLAGEDPALAATARCFRAYAFCPVGELHAARRLLEESLRLEPLPGIPLFFDLHRMSRSLLASVLSVTGEGERARAEAQRALDESRRFGAAPDMAHCALLAAQAAFLRGDAEAARSAAALALRVSEENDFPSFAVMARFYSAAAARHLPVASRIAVMQESLAERRAFGEHWDESLLLALLAAAHVESGRRCEAERAARQGLEFARRAGERHHESGLLRIIGECVAASDRAAAGAILREAVDVAAAQGAETLRRRASESLLRLTS